VIEHHLDVGSASPLKQQFNAVSPAFKNLMYGEIGRLLELGVIEKLNSARSSPMRLVVKPGKVRLCLDTRKINTRTYPIPSIDGSAV